MDPFAGSKYSARDRREAGVPSPSSTSDPPAQRHVKRFADLTPDETCDLCITAKDVGVRLEQYHKASSLTFTIQIHAKSEILNLDIERKDRTMEEMSQEANEYRALFSCVLISGGR
uniref:Uncharacterized protein n=1 Tax=Leersia perrieri TaxID=77586 RepID=A0A0D9XNJ1_9ORYZ